MTPHRSLPGSVLLRRMLPVALFPSPVSVSQVFKGSIFVDLAAASLSNLISFLNILCTLEVT